MLALMRSTTKPNTMNTVSTVTAEQIQKEILSSQQALLMEANAILKSAEEAPDHTSKLEALGFTGSSEALKRKQQAAKQLADLEDQYSFEYPGLKFIPTKAMQEVCAKYGLAVGHVSRYLGEVPPWALEQIEANKRHIGEEEILYLSTRLVNGHGVIVVHLATGEQAIWEPGRPIPVAKQSNLYIAAPRDEMRLMRNEYVDASGQIVATVHDPIVCLKVSGGYIVLAAWGEEGRDPKVFNAQSN